MLKSNRNSDSKHENIINSFVYKYFFIRTKSCSEYVYDRERQVQGIDVIADGKTYDIKAQSSKKYINHPVNTYILEVMSNDRLGEMHIGWFLNKSTVTDYYTFVWINSAKVNDRGRIEDPEDIEEIEVMSVDVKQLKQYVNSIASDEKLIDTAYNLRNSGKYSTYLYNNDGEELKVICASSLFEKPVNIVMSKQTLRKFATDNCLVSKTHITHMI